MGSRRLALELAVVTVVSLAVLAPGITGYSLVDPWETHYGEVGRMMRQDHDYVHLRWPGTNASGAADEGFVSKPVLSFWLIAAGMAATGVARDGGYSGEMVAGPRTMLALRAPFVAVAVLGLVLMWWMLATLVDRRTAWLALLVVGSSPMFCLVARQAIPDMPLTATVIGALALFALAMEDGGRPASRTRTRVALAVCAGPVVIQAIYYAGYFIGSPWLAVRGFPAPAVVLPAIMLALLAGLWQGTWGALRKGVSYGTRRWPAADAIVAHALAMSPLTSMRQVYLLGCYAFLGIGLLAKGPPGLGVVGLTGIAYVAVLGQWRELYDGKFELKRGILLIVAIALPWHIAEFLKEGIHFLDEYLFTHILQRAVADPDKSPGTFEVYLSQLGYGMWLWAALLPAAVAAAVVRARIDTREARVRLLIALWAICGVAFFSIIQTKFHHYILPIVPALGVLVAMFLADVLARRDRLHPIYAVLAIAIVALVCRDLTWDPKRWIEMFMFNYTRPWPSNAPWQVDPSSGFLRLGAIAAAALVVLALPWRRLGVAAVGLAGLAICAWSLHVYMPIAGTHWGMREAMRAYYEQRTIYGDKLVYFGARELAEDWADAGDRWTFDTFVPDALQVGQPMTITIELHRPDDDRITEQTVALTGAVAAIGDHVVTVALPHAERARLDPLIARGKAEPRRGRPPIRAVDADRLIAYQLYWRGENFWSAEDIWGPLPELKASFLNPDKPELNRYLSDRSRAPLGRRYFVITDTGHTTALRSQLPTQRARDTFDVIDSTSNKFAMSAFWL